MSNNVRSAALGATCLLAMTTGAAAQDSPSPHDRLAAWSGHWKIHTETKATQYSHAKTADYDANCSFLAHGGYMACDYLSLQVDSNAGRTTNDLSVFYYNPDDKTFKHTGVGPEEDGAHEGIVVVDGNVWTRALDVPRKNGGTATIRFTYTFLSPNKQSCRFEISTDKGAHWTLVTESMGTKAS
jgi:hypothetical protein